MRPFLLALLVALVAVLTPASAQACSCAPGNVSTRYDLATHVLRARVLADLTGPSGPRVFQLEVLDDLKSCAFAAGDVIEVSTARSSATCGTFLGPVGSTWIVHASGAPGALSTNDCAGNRNVSALSAGERTFYATRPLLCTRPPSCVNGTPWTACPDACTAALAACPSAQRCVENPCAGCRAELYERRFGAASATCLPW